MRRVVLLAFLAACTESHENPMIESSASGCGSAARLVRDVCTQLGPDDGCVDVDDVCIALCDHVQSCTNVDPQLRVLDGFPTAPNGYCVVCKD